MSRRMNVANGAALSALVAVIIVGIALAMINVFGAGSASLYPARASWVTPDAMVNWCDHEDGSGDSQTYPCVWDARRQGNHVGTSILYVRGTDGGCFAELFPWIQCYDIDAEWFVVAE